MNAPALVAIDKAENGYVLRIAQKVGDIVTTYIASTPTELAEVLITALVKAELT
jgi:hypothetical protein